MTAGDDYEPPEAPSGGPTHEELVKARLAEYHAGLYTSADLDTIPDPQPVIDGLLYRESLAWLYGKPGSYKSVLGVDWASCVSTGLPWCEHEVTTGPVLYLYLEGRAGLRKRVRAWEEFTGYTSLVTFMTIPVQLIRPVDVDAFKHLVGDLGPSLVVIDTQQRATLGVEENSTKEMGQVVAAASSVVEVCRPCLLFLHHEARHTETLRGSIVIDGSATSLFQAKRDRGRVILVNERQRDAEQADAVELWPHQLNGSVVLAGYPPDDEPLPAPLSAPERLLLGLLGDEFADGGASATVLRKTSNLPESTFYRVIRGLVKRGLARKTKGRYYAVTDEEETG